MATVVLDSIDNCRFRDSLTSGMQVVRPVTVKDITFGVGEATTQIWLKCVTAAGFPILGELFDPSYPAILLQRELRGIDRFRNVVQGELIYGAPPESTVTQTINYTLTDATQTHHVITHTTSDGSENLYTLYKKDGNPNVLMDDVDAQAYHFGAPKIEVFRSLRCTGYARGEQWDAVKHSIRAYSGTLNNTDWGDDERGRWLFIGPITRTADQGNSYVIQLDFVRGRKPHSFFPIGLYYDILGIHPKDAATESELIAGIPSGNPPTEGAIYRTNGASIASIYEEAPWPALFSFTPDD